MATTPTSSAGSTTKPQTEAEKAAEATAAKEATARAEAQKEAQASAADKASQLPEGTSAADATGELALSRAEADQLTGNINTPSVPNPSGDGFVDPETLPAAQRRIIPQAVAYTANDGMPVETLAQAAAEPAEFEVVNVVVKQRCYDADGRTLEAGDRTNYRLEKGKTLPAVFEAVDRPVASGK